MYGDCPTLHILASKANYLIVFHSNLKTKTRENVRKCIAQGGMLWQWHVIMQCWNWRINLMLSLKNQLSLLLFSIVSNELLCSLQFCRWHWLGSAWRTGGQESSWYWIWNWEWELTKMLILHDWDADTVLSQNRFGLLTQDSEEIVGLQFYRKRYFYCSWTTMKYNDRL